VSIQTKKLTVAEFLALDLPDDETKRYELHHGEIVEMTGPKPPHSNLQTALTFVLGLRAVRHPELRPVVEPNLDVGEGELRRPDLIVVRDPEHGGCCVEGELAYAGPPEVVVEVLSSKPWRDLVEKRELYAAAGIPEYWVLSPDDGEALFLRLEAGEYRTAARLREGLYETPLLPGFRLDVGALFRRDFAALAAALEG
jgi:Uma2 family endonuclease